MSRIREIVEATKLPTPSVRRALRVSAGLSLETVAGLLGVHKTAVSRWERGRREPRGDLRSRYAVVLSELREALKDA
jgi:transcriptional regulator with XRE-family HTH domain